MIKEIEVGRIMPDASQPRKYKSDVDVEHLAESIKNVGQIYPIEVDENNVIVTGELRFLALKKLGAKLVPVRVIKGLTPEMRLLRQLTENLKRHEMRPIEEAQAYAGILRMHFGEKSRPTDDEIKWLASQIGGDAEVIAEKLALLKESKKFQRAVDEGEIPKTAIRAIKMLPKELQRPLRDKIMKKEAGGRDATLKIARRINERPDKAAEILEQNFSMLDSYEVAEKLQEIAPSNYEEAKNEMSYFEEVEKLAKKLNELILLRHPFKDKANITFPTMSKVGAYHELRDLCAAIPKWCDAFDRHNTKQR